MERWIERYRGVLFFGLVVAALAGLCVYEVRQPEPVPLLPTSQRAVDLSLPTATPGPMRVYVSGAVRQPGVVSLPPGSIVEDAIAAAGGASAEADLERINLAQVAQDGGHIHVPRRGEEGQPQPLSADGPAQIDLNTADVATLDTLPGIGPELARRIVDYRQAHGPYGQVEDLLNVDGIGPTTLADIRDQIRTK